MAFFSRPNLDNIQFKQLSGSTLTLSGQTQINNISGLSINDGTGTYIPIIVTGGTDFDVLTYCSGKITLQPVAGGGSGIYSGASPTTCTVGGLSGGTAIYGCSITCILEDILVPTLYPTLTDPSSSFSVDPTTTCYEVGSTISITGCSTLDYGCICQYWGGGSSSYRSGLALCYEYNIWGGTICCPSSYLPTHNIQITGHTVTYGNNTLSGKVWYSGGTQPYDSAGSPYLSGLTSGCTISTTVILSGIYPYYYGTYASGSAASGNNRPTTGLTSIITGGTKIVANSSGTLCINFNSTTDDYIWFATPSGSTSKTKWYVNPINCGTIGGVISPGGNLFPDLSVVTGVSTVYWSGQSYNLYVSNYQTEINTIMELRNT